MPTRHYHNHYRFSYQTSLSRHFTSLLAVVGVIVLGLFAVVHSFYPQEKIDLTQISIPLIGIATLNTLYRLTLAYVISLVLSIPLVLLITKNSTIERIMLPILDIIQSIPVLAFFPVLVFVFIQINFLEGAAIFIIVMDMVWNILFTMIGGLKTIPEDINSAAKTLGAVGYKKLRYVTLPAILPSIITGSFLAWGQGWNISIIAEALHTFIPNGDSSHDLLGLGSLLVNSFAQSRNAMFLASLSAMIVVITLLNFFVWQKLLRYVERYKFD